MLGDLGNGPDLVFGPFFHVFRLEVSERKDRQQMTIQPVPQLDELAEAEAMFASVHRSLAELREALESLKHRAASGEEIDGTLTAKTFVQLSDAVGRCQKAGLILYDCRNKQLGIARGGFALDFEKARADIGCKFDRLRCSIDSGGVPE
jgi:hypothetical protein